MTSNMRVQIYRPRQVVLPKAKSRTRTGVSCRFPGGQGKVAAVMAGVALVLGLALTQVFHAQVTDLQARAEQLRTRNTAVANENVRLLAARAQVASKTQVAALAKTKLRLFEPDQGQVRRM